MALNHQDEQVKKRHGRLRLAHTFPPIVNEENEADDSYDVNCKERRKTTISSILSVKRGIIVLLIGPFFLLVVLLQDFGKKGHSWKRQIRNSVNGVWRYAEFHGYIRPMPAFYYTYHDEYPEFNHLEENYEIIRNETIQLLGERAQDMVDMEQANYDLGKEGKLKYNWKTFALNIGGAYLDENARFLPQTTGILKQIPNLHGAVLSVVGPNSKVGPHTGIYKGLLRYHLGLIIPENNKDKNMYMKLNQVDRTSYKKVYEGETYYWKNGKGVMFDDTYVHVARNDSNETRVLLILDVLRKGLPWWLALFNTICIWVGEHDSRVKKVRKKLTVSSTTTMTTTTTAPAEVATSQRYRNLRNS